MQSGYFDLAKDRPLLRATSVPKRTL